MRLYTPVRRWIAMCLPACVLCFTAAHCGAKQAEAVPPTDSRDSSPQQITALQTSKKAEQAVQRFYEAFYKHQWKEAAALVHPESLAALQKMVAHIAGTTSNLVERKEFLKGMSGVETISAFNKLSPQMFFVSLYSRVWTMLSDEAKLMWQSSHISVIGSVKEGEVYHVVVRTNVDSESMPAAIVSVASAKQSQSKWLFQSSTEFQGMISKLRQQAIK